MHSEHLNLREVVVFLVAAGFIVPLLTRFRVSPVLGFLLVGVTIGPYGLARFTDALPFLEYIVISDLEGVRTLAELGVVFLLFMIGLELSLDRLWLMRRAVFGLGGSQVLVSALAIGFIAALFGNTLQVAMVIGLGLALSSTAIVMELLVESRRVSSPTGQTSFSILLFQDLAVLPILLVVQALGSKDQSSIPLALGTALLQAAIAIALIIVVGRLIIRPLFRYAGHGASREMFLAAVLLVIVGTAVATEQAGLSLALGAFLAGVLFAETEYRHAVEVDIEPFKGLLLALFFVSVGMGIDFSVVGQKPVAILVSVIGLFVLKSAITYAIARASGRSHPVALEAAMLLGQGGEFGFLIIGAALTLGFMPTDTAQFMLIVTGLTMFLTPGVAILARRLANAAEGREMASEAPAHHGDPELTGHVIVVGYGRVGRLLGSVLEAQELPLIALDSDPSVVARFRREGRNIVFGTALQPQVLTQVGIANAQAVVVTMDNVVASERVVAAAREHRPDIPIIARARDGAHATKLYAAGATDVIPETIEASLQLGEIVLTTCGVPEAAAHHVLQVRRQIELEDLELQRLSPRAKADAD
jgi:monovalent cation:proton antiporter-2 (CPA2) family protein